MHLLYKLLFKPTDPHNDLLFSIWADRGGESVYACYLQVEQQLSSAEHVKIEINRLLLQVNSQVFKDTTSIAIPAHWLSCARISHFSVHIFTLRNFYLYTGFDVITSTKFSFVKIFSIGVNGFVMIDFINNVKKGKHRLTILNQYVNDQVLSVWF